MTRLIISDAFSLSNPKHGSVGQSIKVVGSIKAVLHDHTWKVMNKNLERLEQEMLLRRYNKTVSVSTIATVFGIYFNNVIQF